MRTAGLGASALLLLAAACGSGAKPACADLTAALSEAADATWSDPPTSAEIIDLLVRSAKLEIRGEQPGCDSVFGAPVPRFTIGEYLSFLLGTMADGADGGAGSRLEATCARDGSAFACELWVSVGLGGESPWRYGLKYRASGDPPAIDPESFECPGGA